MFNLNKNVVVGVSVSPELGLEVAQVDFATRTVLKYACRKLEYDNMRREIADRDVFKQDLGDMLEELQIPKGLEVVINLPPVVFKVTDYPASLAGPQIQSAIEEELLNHPIFQDADPCISAVGLPNSTIQFTKVAYTVAQKAMLEELVFQIKELGYKLLAVDTSVNSTLNALIYNDRVDVAPDAMWVLLLVENNYCRIVSMHGRNYVDCFEERISNVKGKYGFRRKIKAENILLIDDIRTSGATLDECARQLLRAGADRVYCATILSRKRRVLKKDLRTA